MVDVFRQEVWLVNLNPPGHGKEIHGFRPALIMSVDEVNNSPAELVVVLPITTTKRNIPAHIRVDPPEGGLKDTSFIKCDQIRTISKNRLKEKWGSVSSLTVSRVEDALRILLNL